MKIVFENTTKGRRYVCDEEDSHGAFLEIHGGGMNENQTARAMEDRRAVLDGETITVNGIDIYTEE